MDDEDGNLTDVRAFILPPQMVFGYIQITAISVYSVLLAVGLVTNSTLLYYLVRAKMNNRTLSSDESSNRLTLLLINLCLADLIVVIFQLPIDIAWEATVSWRSTDAICRIMVVLKIFGFYSSGFVMTVISLDRLYAVSAPLRHMQDTRIVRWMLALAWIAATLCSLPQAMVFSLKTHPVVTTYQQCTTIGNDPTLDLVYFVFASTMLWGLPILAMLSSYAGITYTLCRKSDWSQRFCPIYDTAI